MIFLSWSKWIGFSPRLRRQEKHGRRPSWNSSPAGRRCGTPSFAHVPCVGVRQRGWRRIGLSPPSCRFSHGWLPRLGWAQRRSPNRCRRFRDRPQDHGVPRWTPLDGERDYGFLPWGRQCLIIFQASRNVFRTSFKLIFHQLWEATKFSKH